MGVILTARLISFALARFSPGFVTSAEHPSQMEPGAWRILSVKMCVVVEDVDLATDIVTVQEMTTAETCMLPFMNC